MISTVPRAVEHGATAVGVLTLLVFGFAQGREIQQYSLDLLVVSVQVVFLDALSSMAVFTCFVAVTGLLLVREVWSSRDAIEPVTDGPRLTAIVPVYRDHDVLETSVESLRESAYDPLEIVVVAEPNDAPTLERARELAKGYDRVECLVNENPGSKAGAINYAVRETDAEYIAVFDADESITSSFLPRAMSALRGDVDVFQGRRIPRPNGVIETIAYCERVVFHASYKLVELSGFANCRSSSTVLSREAFDRVGGYDDMLTEDLNFAHDCYREGLTVRQARQCTNTMEAPHTLRDLWGQRKRWRVGQVEVLHATTLELLSGDIDRRGLVSIGRMCSSLLGCLFTLALTSKLLLLLVLGVESAFLVLATILVATIGGVAWRDASDGRIDGLHWSVVLAPLLYPAFGVLSLKSLLEYGLSWDGTWYHVDKTGS
ncbi:glycosyltransferase family 2 protein [Natrinema pallidum]|uniref:Glycosyl transferase family 2 n=1 Tax=Natrinema pallidum DSM 3751 TaxID=1227495 RepID=L9YKL5_9EURY|nr:glycosyltransferase family 2 protein [Natrinema pallidum]ELY74735.1 glycosyl transferase family 2 [Natrinema pallidum DSM 3751]